MSSRITNKNSLLGEDRLRRQALRVKGKDATRYSDYEKHTPRHGRRGGGGFPKGDRSREWIGVGMCGSGRDCVCDPKSGDAQKNKQMVQAHKISTLFEMARYHESASPITSGHSSPARFRNARVLTM